MTSRQDSTALSYGHYQSPLFEQSDALELIRKQSNSHYSDTSPLGLAINIAPMPSCDNYWPALKQELASLNNHYQRRPVALLEVYDGNPACDQALLCELLFTLGHHFQLQHLGSRVYAYRAPLEVFNDDRLALLKGLGFNRIQIPVPFTQDSSAFTALSVKLAHYQYQHSALVFTKLSHKSILQSLDTEIYDKLIFEASPDQATQSQLTDLGYFRIDNKIWCQSKHPLYRAKCHHQLRHTSAGANASNICDWLGLGADNFSQMGSKLWHNQDQQNYCEQTLDHKQSIAKAQKLNKNQRDIESILAQLDSYGLLNLESLEQSFELDLPNTLPAALRALNMKQWQLDGDDLLLESNLSSQQLGALGRQLEAQIDHTKSPNN